MSPETAAVEPMGPLGIVLIVLGFLVFFPLMWFGVTGLLSVLGGWHELGASYAAGPAAREGRPAGRWVTGGMQRMLFPVSYRNCLNVSLYADGFGLSVARVFRFRHPPLFIPWTAVGDCEERGSFWRYTRITLHASGVRILIGGRAGREVREQWMRARAASDSNAMLAHTPAR
ncbi:MAG TPA: hypothetical protein VHG93_24385 [Longimicrobium sp.]|nr:hypothetical protein [Longimicrobium sp.]